MLEPLLGTTTSSEHVVIVSVCYSKLASVVTSGKFTLMHLTTIFLEHWILLYGIPKNILSDNSRSFIPNSSRSYAISLELRIPRPLPIIRK